MLLVEFVSDSTHSNISGTLPIKANQAQINRDDHESIADSEVSGGNEPLMPLMSTQDFASKNLSKYPPITPHADNPLCGTRSILDSPVGEVLPWSLQDVGERSRNAPIPSARTFFNIRSPALEVGIGSSWPFTTQHQARLFKHYVRELTPWVSTPNIDA